MPDKLSEEIMFKLERTRRLKNLDSFFVEKEAKMGRIFLRKHQLKKIVGKAQKKYMY